MSKIYIAHVGIDVHGTGLSADQIELIIRKLDDTDWEALVNQKIDELGLTSVGRKSVQVARAD